jgi:hypothetical protein
VAGVDVEVDDGTLTVTALPRDGADIGLELFSAAERTELLAGALELAVEVAGAT